MSKTKQNTRARSGAGNKAELSAAVVNVLSEAGVTGYADTMLEALHAEAKAVEAAGASAWQVIRDTFRTVLETHGDDAARVVLARFRDRAKLEGDAGRAANYSSTLTKALKAKAGGAKLPDTLWKASRKEWIKPEADGGKFAKLFAETKGKQGRKPGGKTSKPEAKPEAGKATQAESIGAAAVSSFKAKEADALSEVLKLVDGLRGPFRKEWLDAAKESALAISARQAQASTGTK